MHKQSAIESAANQALDTGEAVAVLDYRPELGDADNHGCRFHTAPDSRTDEGVEQSRGSDRFPVNKVLIVTPVPLIPAEVGTAS
jgi:hypothetical protein